MIKEQPVDREAFLARLNTRREELGMSEQRVCKEAGLSTSAIKNIRARPDQVPTLKIAVPIARVLGLNPEWLAFGRGGRLSEDSVTVISIEEAERNGGGHAPRNAIVAGETFEPGRQGIVREIDARAGAGNGAVGEIVQLEGGGISSGHAVTFEWGIPPELMRFYFGADPTRVVILPVKGDSMHPTLSDGDRVLIDLNDTVPNDGGIFLLDEGHGPIVKRARILADEDGHVIEIISDNTALSPVRRRAEDVRVIGRVRGRWTRI